MIIINATTAFFSIISVLFSKTFCRCYHHIIDKLMDGKKVFGGFRGFSFDREDLPERDQTEVGHQDDNKTSSGVGFES